MKQLGGTGIIGQDMVCGFGKRFPLTIKKWYNGFISNVDGEITPNLITFPTAQYTDLIKINLSILYSFEGLNDCRIRIYDKNKQFIPITNGNRDIICTFSELYARREEECIKDTVYVRLNVLQDTWITGEVIIKEVS